MKYEIKTNVKTLKKVWNLLADLGIAGLLFGTKTKLEPETIVNKVVSENKVNELLQTITGDNQTDFEELEIEEVIEIISCFFVKFASSIQGLASTFKVQTQEVTTEQEMK